MYLRKKDLRKWNIVFFIFGPTTKVFSVHLLSGGNVDAALSPCPPSPPPWTVGTDMDHDCERSPGVVTVAGGSRSCLIRFRKPSHLTVFLTFTTGKNISAQSRRSEMFRGWIIRPRSRPARKVTANFCMSLSASERCMAFVLHIPLRCMLTIGTYLAYIAPHYHLYPRHICGKVWHTLRTYTLAGKIISINFFTMNSTPSNKFQFPTPFQAQILVSGMVVPEYDAWSDRG